MYKNDITVKGNDADGMKNLKKCLVKEYEIKEFKEIKVFFEIKVAYSRQGILYPNKNVLQQLTETRKFRSKTVDTLIKPNLWLGDALDNIAKR